MRAAGPPKPRVEDMPEGFRPNEMGLEDEAFRKTYGHLRYKHRFDKGTLSEDFTRAVTTSINSPGQNLYGIGVSGFLAGLILESLIYLPLLEAEPGARTERFTIDNISVQILATVPNGDVYRCIIDSDLGKTNIADTRGPPPTSISLAS